VPNLQAPKHRAGQRRKDETVDPGLPRLQMQENCSHYQGLVEEVRGLREGVGGAGGEGDNRVMSCLYVMEGVVGMDV